ncbi:hypothetical protein [Streptomyces sp. NPDC052036]|uniref:hypothetical protein n=1 Tax=Streptomyces sp. NPDC052036 TaxID=3155171 RepID=UPI00342283F4
MAAEQGTGVPACPIFQQHARTVQVPAVAGPHGFPNATGEIDTGVCVREAVRLTATGLIAITSNGTPTFGPGGDPTRLAGQGFPLQGVPSWSLIGRIGNGPWQYIGTGPTTLVGRGELFLAVNDDFYSDNSGFFTATVTRCTCAAPLGSVTSGLADARLPGLGVPCSD